MKICLKDKMWSPYIAGIIIGLLQIPAYFFIKTALGVSSSYVTVIATIMSWIYPAIDKIDYAAKHMTGMKNWWQVALVVGIALGAYLSSYIAKTRKVGFAKVAGESRRKRYVFCFLGGIILIFGARLADGCATGHGISGVAHLSVGSILTIFCMLGAGIGFAKLFNFKR